MPFLAPHCNRLTLSIGDLVVKVDETVLVVLDDTQVGFFVGHVVAIPGFFELVVIGFEVVVRIIDEPGEGG